MIKGDTVKFNGCNVSIDECSNFNDGIAIDINQNGKIDLDERSAQSHTINGVPHTFNIIW